MKGATLHQQVGWQYFEQNGMGFGFEALHTIPAASEIITLPVRACVSTVKQREQQTPFDTELYNAVKSYMDKTWQNIDNPVFYNRYLENYLVTLPFLSMLRDKEN